MKINFNVGILKGLVNERSASDLINKICIERDILDLDLNLRKSFVDRILLFQGNEYEFTQITLESTNAERTTQIMKEICSSLLDKGIPCYYGEQFWHTASPDVNKRGFILHAPSDDGKFDGGGIAVITSFVDDRCKIEFNIETFVDDDYSVKFYPLDLVLPTTYADFTRAADAYLRDEYGDDKEKYSAFLDACLKSLARACLIYDPRMIWLHDVPNAIGIYMKDMSIPSKTRATSIMDAIDVERLGLERFLSIGDEVIPVDKISIDVFFDMMMSDTMDSLESSINAYLENLKNSKYKDKKITIKRLMDRKFLIEIDDDETTVRDLGIPKLRTVRIRDFHR